MLRPLLKSRTLDKRDPNNYRGIALLASLGKLFATLVEGRITKFDCATGGVCKTQFGFTSKGRTMDACMVLDTLIDRSKRDKRALYVAFIDFQKAYDYVWQDGLFYKMLENVMEAPILRIVRSMYESVKSIIQCGREVSEVICVSVWE